MTAIVNSSLRAKRMARVEQFLPHYLTERHVMFRPKSLEQQRLEFAMFKAKWLALKETRKLQ